eukprot:2687260-Rhodomonas_salina.2
MSALHPYVSAPRPDMSAPHPYMSVLRDPKSSTRFHLPGPNCTAIPGVLRLIFAAGTLTTSASDPCRTPPACALRSTAL